MEAGGIAIGASTITSVFTATLRISQAVYELKAVGQQTRDLLDTTKYINDSMRNVRVMRRQKSGLLTAMEKEWIDREIQNSEKAVSDVAALLEPARVDMQAKSKNTKCENTKDISFRTRVMFVLRDSPKVAVQLTQLAIATQGLNGAMIVLCMRESHGGLAKFDGGTTKRPNISGSSPTGNPPPYELTEFLNRRRTMSTGLRPKELDHNASTVSVDEDGSDNESILLRTKSSRVTIGELPSNSQYSKVESKDEESDLAALPGLSTCKEAIGLDRFDESPTHFLVGEATPPDGSEAYLAVDGHGPCPTDVWRSVVPRQAPEEQQSRRFPKLNAGVGFGHPSLNPLPSTTTGQTSLDISTAIPGNLSYINQSAQPEELLPSHPPPVPHSSRPIAFQMAAAYPPSIPLHPTSLQQQPSTRSLRDRYVRRTSGANPQPSIPQPSPFYFRTPQMCARENGNLTTWGENRPNEAMHPSVTGTTTNDHQPALPYPDSPPPTPSFPPPTHVLGSWPPLCPTPANPPRRKPVPTATPPSPPAANPHPSLGETAIQNQSQDLHNKSLPDLPFGRNPSVTSLSSTASEAAGGVDVGGARMSRGKMWLEHHAERAFAMPESASGPLSGAFLAPLSPQNRVREV